MIKLTTGDKVALIAPASGQKPQDHHLIDKATTLLEHWGLSVTLYPVLASGHRYLAASDEERSQSLLEALHAIDIKAIFTTRGGYGCSRLIPHLAATDIHAPTPRLLIGFSDITTLHLYFTKHHVRNVSCIHAANIATLQFLANTTAAKENRKALYNLLFLQQHSEKWETTTNNSNISDWHTQPKTGGCLSIIVSSLGTPYEIDTTNRWLFIEEVSESPYVIDRMLMHLAHAGKLQNAQGLVIGSLTGCNTATIQSLDIISEYATRYSLECIYLPYWGHGDINLPWLYR